MYEYVSTTIQEQKVNSTTSYEEETVSSTEIPISVNKFKVLRIGVSGDMDCNSDQSKQFNLLKDYNVDIFLSGGDYDYENGECVLKDLTERGFNSSNSLIAVGNHDSCSELKEWLGNDECFGKETFSDGRLDVWTVDTNQDFGDTSSQFSSLKSSMIGSQAEFKMVVVHEPFVTADSKHKPNGEFDTYHELFKDAGINVVIQAHNHNYQRFLIDDVLYYVVGTGTHDEGSGLYNIESDDFNGHELLKGIDDKNGIAIFDLSTNITQWFISNSNRTLDKFVM